MSTAERIIQELSGLRPEKKTEENLFFESSLSLAMRGMEDEDAIYSEADILMKSLDDLSR